MELDPIMCGPGGNPCTGTITLTGPAPYEGMTFYLRTRNTPNPHCGELPTVPPTVTIAGGSLSAAFPVTTSPGYGYYVIEVSQIANFPAQATGGKVFWVSAPPFSLEVPQSVKGGNAVQGTLRLTGAAMSSNCGNRYTLASSNANVAQAPPYMDVTPGGTQAAFPITTAALSTAAGPQSVTIYVTGPIGFKAEQQTREKTLTVTP